MFCMLLKSGYLHKQFIVLQGKIPIFTENLSQLSFCYFDNFHFLFVLQNVGFLWIKAIKLWEQMAINSIELLHLKK